MSRGRNRPLLLRKISAALALALPAGAFAQLPPLTYDGTAGPGTVQLMSMQILDWNSPKTGAAYYDSSYLSVASGADLIIDYAPGSAPDPEYVLGGGSPVGGDVSGNTVTIKQGNIQGSVYGGLSLYTVTASDDDQSAVIGSSAVAYANANLYNRIARAHDNTVAVKGNATVTENLYGGYAAIIGQAGNAEGGTASPASSQAQAFANASANAYSSEVRADDNTVIVTENASVAGDLDGGQASIIMHAGTAQGGTANANNAEAKAHANANANAYFSRVSADDNTVIVTENASVTGDLRGGRAAIILHAGTSQGGTAHSNNGKADTYASAYIDAHDAEVRADDNRVAVTEHASVTGSLYGGHAALEAHAGRATSGWSTASGSGSAIAKASTLVNLEGSQVSASGNTVTLDGRLHNGSIYGGYVRLLAVKGIVDASASNGEENTTVNLTLSRATATNNIVTIGDHATLSGNVSLYGGFLDYNTADGYAPERYDVFTGNTLNFSAQPVSVHTVANFEKYNFTLQPSLANQPTALISAQQIVLGSNADNLDSAQAAKASEIRVVGIHSGNALNAGDQFVLMRAASSLSGSGIGLTSTGVAQQGISLRYDVETRVDLAGKEVTATILACQAGAGETCPSSGSGDGSGSGSGGDSGAGSGGRPAARVNPQLKALSEGYLGGAMLVARGADRLADEGFDAIAAQASGSGASSFALASASRSRYDSGSHVTSNDQFLAAGLGVRQEAVTAAAFVESGWGNYDSHNSFYNAASVDGDGNTRYYGAGLLGRYAFTGGFYTEASVRAGRTRLSFDTGDLQNLATGEFARYRLHSRYVSAHLGVGYELPLTADQTLDLSAKYLGSRVGGKHVTVAGDPLHFERVDSQRLRLNAELAHRYSPAVTLKAGLGYEREFDGEAKATTYGSYKIEAPSVKGGTGLLSLGASVRPTANRNLTLDLAATGYAGKRDGGGASVQVQYRF
jgi:hypothetical protein